MEEAQKINKPGSAKKKLYVFAVVLLVAVITGLAFLLIPRKPVYFTDMKQRNTGSGVSLLVPSGWTSPTETNLTFLPADANNQTSPVRIKVTEQSEVVSGWSKLSADTQKKIVDDIFNDAKEGKYDFGFQNPTTTTINGIYGIVGETVESSSNYTSQARGLAFVSVGPNGKQFKVVAMAPVEDFKANKSGMQKVIESFRYVDDEAEK